MGRAAPARALEAVAEHPIEARDPAILAALVMAGLPGERGARTLRTAHDVAALAAVRAGSGIGPCQVPSAARDPGLVRVLPRREVTLEVWVVTHEDLRRVRRVRATFDHLVEALADSLRRAAPRRILDAPAAAWFPGSSWPSRREGCYVAAAGAHQERTEPWLDPA